MYRRFKSFNFWSYETLFVDESSFFEISIAVIEDKIEIEVLPDISISEIQQKEENKFALLILENLVDKIEFKEKSVLLVKNKRIGLWKRDITNRTQNK